MRRLPLISVLLLVLAAAAPAARARAGSIDRGFGRGGVVVRSATAGVDVLWPASDGGVRWLEYNDDTMTSKPWATLVAATARGHVLRKRRLLSADGTTSEVPYALVPLGDGGFVGELGAGYGGFTVEWFEHWTAGGRSTGRIGPDTPLNPMEPVEFSVAAGPGGRMALATTRWGGAISSTTITFLDASGRPLATPPPRELPGEAVQSLAFDRRGRLIVGEAFWDQTPVMPSRLVRLRQDGTDDPSFRAEKPPVDPAVMTMSADRRRLLITARWSSGAQALLDARTGLPIPVGPAVARLLAQPLRSALFDRRDRLVATDGHRIVRISADGQQLEVLRWRLPANAEVSALAMDARGRILVGARRALRPLLRAPCDGCATVPVPRFRGEVLRLLGS